MGTVTVFNPAFMMLILLTVVWMCSPSVTADTILVSDSSFRSSCKSGWIDAFDENMGCLLFHQETLTWLDCNAFCYDDGLNSNIVEIKVDYQYEFLKGELDSYYNIGGWATAWAGGLDLGTEGDFYYGGSGKPVPSFIWATGEPNSGTGASFMYLHHSYDWKADDTSATTTTPMCICQKGAL